ncbi:MAG: zeaxanthin glucosyltransferase [Maribacter sp.]|jgi:zeaxanthin glucosyltransferase
MAKIICITTGLTGILNASFELVKRLQEAGHEVTYASPSSVGQKVLSVGIPFIQLPRIKLSPVPELPVFKGKFKQLPRLFYKFKHRESRRKEALENTDPTYFSKILDIRKPDLLIIDIELHEYIFKAFAKKTPFILLSQWFSLWNREGLPYLLHDTIPNEGKEGTKEAIKNSWQEIKDQRSNTFNKQRRFSFGTDRRSVLLALAKKEQFPLQYIKENYWPGPFTYNSLPVMSMTAYEMEFPHEPHPALTYIGPMVYDKRIETIQRSINGQNIEEVFSYQKEKKAKLLYCSISTLSKGGNTFIKKIIEAVKSKENWVLILGLGGLMKDDILNKLPSNVFAFSYAPQLKILQKANCSINHGGIHTINECIHYKVPMLIYSGKKSDQNGCAARVHYHSLGVMADKDLDTSSDIQQKINEVLTHPSYQQNINKMSQIFQTYKKDKPLEHLIQQTVQKKLSV